MYSNEYLSYSFGNGQKNIDLSKLSKYLDKLYFSQKVAKAL